MIVDVNSINLQEPLPGLKVRFVHSENMTLAFWQIEEGAVLPNHNHPHEQVSMVTKGEFELTIDDDTKVVKPNEVAVIPSNAFHSAKAITYCEVTDVFYPIREDYK